MHMIKQRAWNTFKNTSNINTYLELIELQNMQKNLKVNKYENVEDKGNNNFRK